MSARIPRANGYLPKSQAPGYNLTISGPFVEFYKMIERDLMDKILKSDSTQVKTPDMLNRAANLYVCYCSKCIWAKNKEWGGGRLVKAYPDVIDHVLRGTSGGKGWNSTELVVDPVLTNAARDVLELLGLRGDCTLEEASKIGKLVCHCGHHAYSDVGLSFIQLVEHIFDERKWNQTIEEGVHPETEYLVKELLQDGHSLFHLKSLVEVADDSVKDYDEEAENAKPKDILGRLVPTQFPPDIPFWCHCRSCYRLTLDPRPHRDGAAHYHIKTKHGRDRRDDDFQRRDVLIAEYGESDDYDLACLFPNPNVFDPRLPGW